MGYKVWDIWWIWGEGVVYATKCWIWTMGWGVECK